MKWIWIILFVLLFLGPLRRWCGRHWAYLISTAVGAGAGLIGATILNGKCGGIYPFLPLAGLVVGALAASEIGPEWIRHVEKDGKNGSSSRRH